MKSTPDRTAFTIEIKPIRIPRGESWQWAPPPKLRGNTAIFYEVWTDKFWRKVTIKADRPEALLTGLAEYAALQCNGYDAVLSQKVLCLSDVNGNDVSPAEQGECQLWEFAQAAETAIRHQLGLADDTPGLPWKEASK